MYDIIGDIHGHADELVSLLELMGYRQRAGGVYEHPSRHAIFVGDFVDRGPKIPEVLRLVRAMVDGGTAQAVMGNHEFNAIAYHTPVEPGSTQFFRKHSEKNTHQHGETLKQFRADTPAGKADFLSWIDWFRTLPTFLEIEKGPCAVHACWDNSQFELIDNAIHQHGPFTPEFLAAGPEGSPLHNAIEIVLKGPEAPVPPGRAFADKEGNERHEFRTRWYMSPVGQSYRSYSLQAEPIESDDPISKEVAATARPYSPLEKPVFFGHYWLQCGGPLPPPRPLASNVACVDYSVAKGGHLCAYRWDGERELDDSKFVWMAASDRDITQPQ